MPSIGAVCGLPVCRGFSSLRGVEAESLSQKSEPRVAGALQEEGIPDLRAFRARTVAVQE